MCSYSLGETVRVRGLNTLHTVESIIPVAEKVSIKCTESGKVHDYVDKRILIKVKDSNSKNDDAICHLPIIINDAVAAPSSDIKTGDAVQIKGFNVNFNVNFTVIDKIGLHLELLYIHTNDETGKFKSYTRLANIAKDSVILVKK